MERSIYTAGSVHVYKMDFTQKQWQNYAGGTATSKLQVTTRNREFFVRITPQGDKMKVYKLTRLAQNQMKEVDGMVQFPVEDTQDSSGGVLIGALLKSNARAFIDAVQSEIDKSMPPPQSAFSRAPPLDPGYASATRYPPEQGDYLPPAGPSDLPPFVPQRNDPYPMNDQPRSHHYGGGPRDRAYSSSSRDQPLEDPQIFNDAYQPKREPAGGVYHHAAPYAGPAAPNASHYGHSEQPSSSPYHPVSRPRSPGPSPQQQRGYSDDRSAHGVYHEPPRGAGGGRNWEGNRSDQYSRPSYPPDESRSPYHPAPLPQQDYTANNNQHYGNRAGGGGAYYRASEANVRGYGGRSPVDTQPPSSRSGMYQEGVRRPDGGGSMGAMPRKVMMPQHHQPVVDELYMERPQPAQTTEEFMKVLMQNMQDAINRGDENESIRLARQLVGEKRRSSLQSNNSIQCSLSVQQQKDPLEEHESFSLEVTVEEQEKQRQRSLYLEAKSWYTIGYLKAEVENRFRIPRGSQTWIIGGKVISADNTTTLSSVGVNDKLKVFLYVTHPRKANIPNEEIEKLRKQVKDQINSLQQQPQNGDGGAVQQGFLPNQPYQGPPGQYQQQQAAYPPAKPAPRNGYPGSQSGYPGSQAGYRDGSQAGYRGGGGGGSQTGYADPQPAVFRGGQNVPAVVTDGGRVQAFVPPAHHEAFVPPPARQEPPPPPEPEKPGWTCGACTFKNKPTKPGCEMCNAPRPGDYEPPPDYQLDQDERQLLEQQQEQEKLYQKYVEEEEQRKGREREERFQQIKQADQQAIVTNTEEFECPICTDDIEVGEGLILKQCLHQVCKNCLRYSIVNSPDVDVKCPCIGECGEPIEEREMREVLSPEEMEEVYQRGLRQAEAAAANAFHCRTPDCKGFCFYEDEVNEFPCQICNHRNCLTCKAIHEDKNCQEYQDDLKRDAANDEAARKTQEMLEQLVKDGEAMNCPSCKIIVTKKVGCDWIRCSVCKTEMCWATKGPRWGPKGHGDTSGGCKCRVGGKRCHPKCRNCH